VAPQSPSSEEIETPTDVIDEGEGDAREDERLAHGPRTLRRFVHRGGKLVEIESVARVTR
jgi:hypothetical protein